MTQQSRTTAGEMATCTVNAYAKVNLILRVLAREVSGHHSLETLFQQLALHDVVTVTVGGVARTLTCDGPTMPATGLGPAEENLAFRAAQAYAESARWDIGWHLAIDKRIPVGGGLGGGSADAGAVLRAMESLSPTPLGRDQLLDLAATLGADVPFLTSNASRAWAWGRGDRFLTLPPLPSATVELYAFSNGVNTGLAYSALAGYRERKGIMGSDSLGVRALDLEDLASWQRIAIFAANDFEPVVRRMHEGIAQLAPLLRARVHQLRAAGQSAIGMMSGSGATCLLLHVPGEHAPPALHPLELPTDCTLLLTTTR